MVTENFKNWACSFSGCDGGNLDADICLCGIEWGSGGCNDGIYYQELPKEIENGAVKLKNTTFDWEESTTYTYGRSYAKLYCAIMGESVENYKKYVKDLDGSQLFKLNLYPIAFDSTDESLWHKYNLDKVTGFNNKYLFQVRCFMNRFPFFSELRLEKKPKLIICKGINYLLDFLMFFGGYQSRDNYVYSGDIEVTSTKGTLKKKRYYWVKLDNESTLVVIPFFSGSYGLNSNVSLEEMGKKIREFY